MAGKSPILSYKTGTPEWRRRLERRLLFRMLGIILGMSALVFVSVYAISTALDVPSRISVDRRFIDLNSGDIRSEEVFLGIVVSSSVQQNGFSRDVRRFGLNALPANWQELSAISSGTNRRLTFACTGADEDCRSVMNLVAARHSDDSELRKIIVKYMSLLKAGNVTKMQAELQSDEDQTRQQFGLENQEPGL